MDIMKVGFEVKGSDIENWQRIRQFIFKKYGKLHGVLGKEAINLMLLGLEQMPDTHTQKHLTRTINNRYRDLLSFLSQYDEIDEGTLKTHIEDNIGIDLRTYTKYFDILVSRNILEFSRLFTSERIRMYSVNLIKVRRELKRLK